MVKGGLMGPSRFEEGKGWWAANSRSRALLCPAVHRGEEDGTWTLSVCRGTCLLSRPAPRCWRWGEAAKTGWWLWHGCMCHCSRGKVSPHEPKARGNKGCIVWKATLAGCLALKRFASELEGCPQPSLLSVKKFERSWKAVVSFFFFSPHCVLPLYAAVHMHCRHPLCFGSVARC